jgi:phosphopantetheine--protein transferase-like protein
MEERIKNIISQYIKIPVESITAQTVIDRSAVASSIVVHRMYAQLANDGILVPDYTTIKTFGQLTAKVNGSKAIDKLTETVASIIPASSEVTSESTIGVDMENVSAMPTVNDFREDAFYKMNFAPAEMAHCILQQNPYASFAGLFAAKEAIIKADNNLKSTPFSSLVIAHLPNGKPVYNGFQISISHTNDTAIAVAVKNSTVPSAVALTPPNNNFFTASIAMTALTLSILTIILLLFKTC